ncbi:MULTISPECIES: lysozyme [unclassified Ensifer]|uniref:lysozyme n=1 Tax=unclassified Ensifer TaxID=2633371 RepID=UPI000812FE6E|nr:MULTISPECIES: lysozyme [unclassified Ensifer]OCP21885.1 hypothetical protein BC361_25285 [Ensifer sp. LC54]OCP23335.1 hypothetical protein BC363_25480 [Ensifer sp. LC384]
MKTRLRNVVAGATALTAAGAMSVQTVGGFEGLVLYAYQDVVGIWTACYGETKGIKPGMRFSKETCNNMLIDSLIEHEQGMRRCMKAPDSLSDKVYVSQLSLAYNVGVGAYCKSTMLKKLNAGDIRGACGEFGKWVKAGGRTIKGLVTRRAAETKLCLAGV